MRSSLGAPKETKILIYATKKGEGDRAAGDCAQGATEGINTRLVAAGGEKVDTERRFWVCSSLSSSPSFSRGLLAFELSEGVPLRNS